MPDAPASSEGKRKAKRAAASCRPTGSWISAVVALSLASVAHAGPGVWTTGGPYGGYVQALAIDPSSPATLYATTAGGVYKSTDSGGTWTAASTGLTGNVWTLAVDPTTPATLYAGTSAGGVFKSTDAAGTWTAANSGLTTLKVTSLAVDPANPATVYAGAYGGGIFKSTNAGGTWTAANAGLTNLDVYALAVDPLHPATLYAGTPYYYGGGVFKSTDSGGTWTAVTTGMNLTVYALAIDPTTPATLYAGTFYVGVFKSTDSGTTWNPAYNGLPNPCDVTALAIDPANPTTLYAGTSSGGIFKSTNSGSSWSAVNTGLTSLRVNALAVDPTTPSTLYTGTSNGLSKSVDAGAAWSSASAGMAHLTVRALAVDPTNPSTLYTSVDTAAGGVFRSTDSGSTWIPANTGLAHLTVTLAIDPATPATVYAATVGGGVFKTTNSGGTWVAAKTGLWASSVYTLAIDPGTPTTVYAGTSWGVFKSTNAGGTWAEASVGLPVGSVADLAIDPTTPATLYAVTEGGAVYKSTDAGSTWNLANNGLKTVTTVLAIDPATPATLYAGTYDRGVFKSTDAGGTWYAVNAGLTSLHVHALAVTPVALYAGTDTGGVFRTTNGGSTWMAVNNGLTNLKVEALAADPTGATTVYAGLVYGSVWQATPPTGARSDLTLALSDSPDPVTGATPLTYTLGVANAGPDSATFVSVAHTLPTGVAFDSATGSGWTCGESGGVVTCTRPSLAVGAAPIVAVQVTPGPAATLLTSSATVSAAQDDPDLANNSDTETTTVNTPPVWIGTRTKTVLADSGEFVVNGNVTYTITLANTGSAAQADNPGHELVDGLPPTLTLVSASATSGTADVDLQYSMATWNGSLASGGSVTVTVHAAIGPSTALGTVISNQGTVSYDLDGDGTNEATALTDDPDEPGANDPTRFVVVSPAMGFYPLSPCRLIDTRNAAGTFGGPALEAGGDRVFPLFGRCDIPSTARALSVNLTVTQPTAPGNLRLYPAGTPLPLVSTVNYVAGQTRANNAIATLNGLGELAVRCSQATGTAHFVLDVNGYFE